MRTIGNLAIATTLLLSGIPAWAQPMTMPDGSKMDMKGMAPAKKPALPKARLPPAKPIAKPGKDAAPAMGDMPMPNAKSSAPMNGMTMPMNDAPKNAAAPKAGAGEMGGMNMPMPQNAPGTSQPMTMPMNGAAKPSSNMGGMDMANMDGMAATGIFGAYPMTRDASGTSWQPDAARHQGIHAMLGDWMLMGHARFTGVYDSQSGPRGADSTYLAGMLMGMARRDFADGDTLNLRAMLSPDPFMGRRGYPLLLQTGETANGTTSLVDRQHPHDLIMELAASYSHKLSSHDSIFLYGGYPGEPALGPPAFMHRASAIDIPDAPITHHWLDSTHITFGVLTTGFVHDDWKIEVSQFTGREPDQHRFNFDAARFDSTSARASWNPDSHWSLQASWGFLKSPEQLTPTINETRYTASAMYVTPVGEDGSWASMVAWGHKQLSDGVGLNGFLAESEYKPTDLWTLFARAETVENDELFPSGIKQTVGKLSLGAIRDWRVADHMKVGIGGLYAFDFVPSAPSPSYGTDPHGAMAFVRLIAE
jgi:hypothetical protein